MAFDSILLQQLTSCASQKPMRTDNSKYQTRLDIPKQREQEEKIRRVLKGHIYTIDQIMKGTGLSKTVVTLAIKRMGAEVEKCGKRHNGKARRAETYTLCA